MTRTLPFRLVLLVFALLALPALVVAQTPPTAGPTPIPDEAIAADADARVYPPLGLPVAPDAPAPAELPALPASPEAVTQPGNDQEGEWSRVIYRGFDGHDYELFSVGGQTAAYLTRLTDTAQSEAQPMISPDARRVAFVADYDGDMDLYLADYTVDGQLSNVRRLVDMPEDEYAPVWSADGTKLTFYSVGDQGEIFTVRADGSQLTRLTFDAAFDGYPTWSPDGRTIAFSSTRSGGYRIHVMNADGSNVRQLSNQPGSLYPAWSPDGRAIAYSADPDGDGWLDLMIMDASGRNQQLVVNSDERTDTQHPTWLPNNRAVAYARISYISYYGNWYITGAEIDRMSPLGDYLYPTMLAPNYSFDPAWGKIDLSAPATVVLPLPGETPGVFGVDWRGSDIGPAGVRTYQVQMQKNGGAWTDWQMESEHGHAGIHGVGGETYAFRSRGVDYAGNVEPWPAAPDAVTRIESRPPVTQMTPIIPWTRIGTFILLLSHSTDPGGSGVVSYEMQFRRNGGPWLDMTAGGGVSYFDPASGQGQPGDRFDFRVRATDGAQNLEPWPPDPGNASTTLYDGIVGGRVEDNTGTPIVGATASVAPAALAPVASGGDGDYVAYFGPAPATAAFHWSKAGYGALPPSMTALPSAAISPPDRRLLVVLPPADDVVSNGGFEATGWGAWQPGGSNPPALTDDGHSGAAALLGTPAPLFSARQRLTTTDRHEQHATVTLDGNDNAFVLWRSGPDANPESPTSLYSAVRRADGAWLAAVKVLDGVDDYSVVRDEAGRLHAVVLVDNTTYLLHQSALGWSTPEAVPQAAPSRAAYLVAGPGGGLDLFLSRGDGNYHVYHHHRAANGAWSAAIDLGLSASKVQTVVVNGSLHFFGLSEDRTIQHRRLWPAGVWGAMEPVPDAWAIDFVVAAGPAGRIHVGWQLDYSQYEFRYRYLDGDHWGPNERVYTTYGSTVDLSGWAVGPDGQPQALLAYNTTLVYLRRTAAGWMPQLIPTQAHYVHGSMVVDASGGVHLTMLDASPNGVYQAVYRVRDAAGNWSSPLDISQAEFFGHDGALALDSAGHVHAVWLFSPSLDALNDLAYAGPQPASDDGQTTLSQAVAVPAGMAHPTLSFFYAGAGALQLTLDAPGRAPSVIDLPPSPAGMRHVALPLDDAAGRTVTLRFALSQTAGHPPAWATLDEVTLGAAHADVWLKATSGRGVPGRTVEHTLQVGNRGAVPATGVVLTYTLPPELTFVSADPAPSSTAPLRWNLGALPAGGQVTIELTAAVPPAAAGHGIVSSAAAVAADAELETLNNAATAQTLLEAITFIPMTAR